MEKTTEWYFKVPEECWFKTLYIKTLLSNRIRSRCSLEKLLVFCPGLDTSASLQYLQGSRGHHRNNRGRTLWKPTELNCSDSVFGGPQMVSGGPHLVSGGPHLVSSGQHQPRSWLTPWPSLNLSSDLIDCKSQVLDSKDLQFIVGQMRQFVWPISGLYQQQIQPIMHIDALFSDCKRFQLFLKLKAQILALRRR